jgi:hypothetical protein
MASVKEVVSGLVYDYLLKKDTTLAQTFKKKTKAVCIFFIIVYGMSIFNYVA